jgi:hypothetical protein
MIRAKRQEIDRIIVGNQIAIMRALKTLAHPTHANVLEIRVSDIKSWWRLHFDEEVGFSAALGDRPIEKGNPS